MNDTFVLFDIFKSMTSTKLANFRKKLHAHSEVSNKEFETAKAVLAFVSHFKPDQTIEKVGGNGLIIIYKGNLPGPSILIRCDMDALPIQEINTFSYKSKNKEVSHKCGHDGHMTIVAGLAEMLSKNTLKKGKVILLFQPAEETGEGALKVIADKKFSDLKPDYVFALHNLPGYKTNQIVLKEDVFNASVSSMIIKLRGKTAHAAEPENGLNPSVAIAEIIQEFNKRIVDNPLSSHLKIITPIFSKIGSKAYGTSAGEGEIHFTIRTWTKAEMDKLKQQLIEFVNKTAEHHHLQNSIEWVQDFQSNVNHPQAIDFVKQAAQLNEFDILEKQVPFKWGEDFGVFTQQYKGAMFGLGAGETTPSLHNPDYDFPDEISETGIKMFYSIINLILDQ